MAFSVRMWLLWFCFNCFFSRSIVSHSLDFCSSGLVALLQPVKATQKEQLCQTQGELEAHQNEQFIAAVIIILYYITCECPFSPLLVSHFISMCKAVTHPTILNRRFKAQIAGMCNVNHTTKHIMNILLFLKMLVGFSYYSID